MLRIIYFGSSDFSIPGLRACLDSAGFEVVGVITTPPQRQGRGLELTSTPVAQFCGLNQIPFFEFTKLDQDALAETAKLAPDVFIVASYGKLIPESFLKLAKFRLNIHPSLLPKYRGASPLNGPILAGDLKTGLSIADITKDLDAGDVYIQEEIPIATSTDSEELSVLLAEKSYSALQGLLKKIVKGSLQGVSQNHSLSTYAPKLRKEDGRLSFDMPAVKWDRLVRGLKPWPGAFAEIQGERVALVSVRIKDARSKGQLGIVLEISSESIVVQTSEGSIEWIRVKPAGKKEMSAADYARGRRWQIGTRLQ